MNSGGVPPAEKLCPSCQQVAPIDASFCSRCGHRYQTVSQAPPAQPYGGGSTSSRQSESPFQQPGPQFQQPPSHPYGNYQQPPQYGAPQQQQADSTKLVITLMLWFFLGTLGAHRLFLGEVGGGVTMLILSIVGYVTMCFFIGFIFLAIVWVWWLIDLVLILTANLKPRDGTRLI